MGTMQPLFSDRQSGGPIRDQLTLPESTSLGLIGLVERKKAQNWFAFEYPIVCPDGLGVTGTDDEAFDVGFGAVVPGGFGSRRPYGGQRSVPDDETVFDLVEYAASVVRKPKERSWHSFFGHYELDFDRSSAQKEFRDEVNRLLGRGNVAFELDSSGQIVRLGLPEHRAVLQELRPNSGDDQLDTLLLEAVTAFQSRHEPTHRQGFERLWDALERLKTIAEPESDKKASAEALLSVFQPEKLQEELRREMKGLTDIGNQFDIRHKETNKVPVPDHAMDYLFHRLAGLIVYLLRHTGRLR